MKTAEIFSLCMIVAVVSFLGFVVENVWLALTKGFIDNRNMCLPFLLGYGLAIVAIYLLIGTPEHLAVFGKPIAVENQFLRTLVYFLLVMFCVSVGEIALGTFVEKTCHIVWWDYTRLPMHFTRYTSVPTSMGFAAMITIFMQRFFEPLRNHFIGMEFDKLQDTAIACMVVLVADFLYNAVRVYKNKKMQPLWRIDLKNTKMYELLHS